MNADTRPHGVFLKAISFIYSSTGFAVSLLALVFGIFIRTEAKLELQRTPVRSRPPSRRSKGSPSPSKQAKWPVLPLDASSLNTSLPARPPPKRTRIYAHRRVKSSSSIPTITIQRPDHDNSFNASTTESHSHTICHLSITSLSSAAASSPNLRPTFKRITSTPLPTPVLSPPPRSDNAPSDDISKLMKTPSAEESSVSSGHNSELPRQRFRLSSLKSAWGGKKSKISRSTSSPNLRPSTNESPPPLPALHYRNSGSSSNGEEFLTTETKSKRISTISSSESEKCVSQQRPSNPTSSPEALVPLKKKSKGILKVHQSGVPEKCTSQRSPPPLALLSKDPRSDGATPGTLKKKGSKGVQGVCVAQRAGTDDPTTRTVEKKSQILRARTMPYEAPYFFPQPTPNSVIRSDRVDCTGKGKSLEPQRAPPVPKIPAGML